MKQLKKVDYEKQLENKIEELQEIIQNQNQSLEVLTNMFKVKGRTFCFTGSLKKYGRKYWIKRILNEGGKVSESVNYYCTYCVTNDESMVKEVTKKADRYQLVFINEDQLLTLMNNM